MPKKKKMISESLLSKDFCMFVPWTIPEKKKKEKKNVVSLECFPCIYFFLFSAIESGLFDFYKWQSIEDGKLESNAQDQLHTIRASIRTLLSLVEGQADANVKCKFCFYIISF